MDRTHVVNTGSDKLSSAREIEHVQIKVCWYNGSGRVCVGATLHSGQPGPPIGLAREDLLLASSSPCFIIHKPGINFTLFCLFCRVGAFPRGMTGSIQTVSEFGKILTEGQKDNCLPRLQFTYCDDNLLSKQVPRTGYPVNFPSYNHTSGKIIKFSKS